MRQSNSVWFLGKNCDAIPGRQPRFRSHRPVAIDRPEGSMLPRQRGETSMEQRENRRTHRWMAKISNSFN